jgi:DNA-binding NtrC family response regulator
LDRSRKSPTTVLIVEDDALTRLFLGELIEEAGFSVVTAGSADEAIGVLETNTIDVLLTDIYISGPMNGMELMRAANVRWPALPAIVTSGYRYVADTELPPNAVFFLKPYIPGKIIGAIRAFDSGRSRRSLQ